MKIKRVKLEIVLFLICALFLCSFSFKSLPVYAEEVGVIEFSNYLDGILSGPLQRVRVYDYGNGYECEVSIWYSDAVFSGVSFSPSLSFSYVIGEDEWGDPIISFNFADSWDDSNVYTADLYYVSSSGSLPTDTPTPTPTVTPTPWVNKYYGSGNITSFLYFFNGGYPSNSDTSTWFDPANQIFSKIIVSVSDNTSFTGDIELPFPYILNKSFYPVLVNRTAEGYNNREYQGTFSVGNEDGSLLRVNGLARPGYSGQSCDLFISVITVTPTPTLSPTPTLTPYPSSAPAAFSTYTINFVAPNGYIVGTVRPVLSIGSSYSGAISALTFSFLDGWFSYGDEVDGEKGSFTWEYSFSENFGEYLWHFSTISWPASESINIPVYRLDGEYPEVVPDLNNVSDLFDTIGKTDPQNFSWFYDGLQAFIDINWSWAFLMLLFPLFVMLWAFFRRH